MRVRFYIFLISMFFFINMSTNAQASVENRSSCVVIQPVRDLAVEGFYVDARSSIPDPQALTRHQSALRPIRDFRDVIAQAADAWLKNHVAPSSCVLTNLRNWVKEDALALKSQTHEATYEKTRFIFSVAISLSNMRDAISFEMQKDAVNWLERLALTNLSEFRVIHLNSDELYLWMGAMAASIYRLDRDDNLLYYTRICLEYADRAISGDGIFVPEIRRGQRFNIYQASSMDAIIFMKSITTGFYDGVELSDLEEKLAKRVLKQSQDQFVALDGGIFRQEPVEQRYLVPICIFVSNSPLCSEKILAGYQFGGDPRLWIKKVKKKRTH